MLHRLIRISYPVLYFPHHEKITLYILVILTLLTLPACRGKSRGGEDTSVVPAFQTETVQGIIHPGAFFSINEIGLGPGGYVSLQNFTEVEANLAGLYLCQADRCFELPDATHPPGETGRIAVGDGAGLGNLIVEHATSILLNPSDGEIALFDSTDVHDPVKMLIYFQWGSTPHALTSTAVSAGLWVGGSYAPTSQNATRLFRDEETGLWLFDEP